jgi:hypothetical protein
MHRPASAVTASQGRLTAHSVNWGGARLAATRIAAFLRGREDSRRDDDDDDDLPRPNATISGLFPQLRFARPAVA